MPSLALWIGAALVALGVGGVVSTSVNADATPAVAGILFIAVGLAASRESIRKHVMHVAALLSLAGIVLGIVNVPAMSRGIGIGLSILCLIFLVAAVRSFIVARVLPKT